MDKKKNTRVDVKVRMPLITSASEGEGGYVFIPLCLLLAKSKIFQVYGIAKSILLFCLFVCLFVCLSACLLVCLFVTNRSQF